MKLRARKLHNAVNNNNVFRAVRFTCATAGEKRASKKIYLLCFPHQEYYTAPLASVQLAAFRRAGVQETVPLFPSKRTHLTGITRRVHIASNEQNERIIKQLDTKKRGYRDSKESTSKEKDSPTAKKFKGALKYTPLTSDALKSLPKEVVAQALTIANDRYMHETQQMSQSSMQKQLQEHNAALALWEQVRDTLSDLYTKPADSALHDVILNVTESEAPKAIQNLLREVQFKPFQSLLGEIRQRGNDEVPRLRELWNKADAILDHWERQRDFPTASEQELQEYEKCADEAFKFEQTLKKIIEFIDQRDAEKAISTYHDEILNITKDMQDTKTAQRESLYRVWRAFERIWKSFGKEQPLSVEEEVLFTKGYAVLDPKGSGLPREIEVIAWRADAEKLTGRESLYDRTKHPADDLKEFKDLTRTFLDNEFKRQALKDISTHYKPLAEQKEPQVQPWPYDFHEEPADREDVLQGVQQYLETGEEAKRTIKVLDTKGKPQDFTIHTKWHKMEEKIKNIGIVIQFDREEDGFIKRKGKEVKNYKSKVETKKVVITPEPIALCEKIIGMDFNYEIQKEVNKIVDYSSLVNALKGTRDTSVPIRDNDGNEIRRLYPLNNRGIIQSGYDELRGDISIHLGYNISGTDSGQSGSQMIIVADLDQKNIYVTDQRGDLCRDLNIHYNLLTDIYNKNPAISSTLKARFRSYLIGKPGWHRRRHEPEPTVSQASGSQ